MKKIFFHFILLLFLIVNNSSLAKESKSKDTAYFELCRVKYLGTDISDYPQICNDPDLFTSGWDLFNVQSNVELRPQYIYKFTENGIISYYLILEVLERPIQDYPELLPDNVSDYIHIQSFCSGEYDSGDTNQIYVPEGNVHVTVDENYIHNQKMRDPVSYINQINENTRKIETVTYYDGLGRPKQEVLVRGGGNQEDIINYNYYDSLGLQTKQYLPYAKESDIKGAYTANALSQINSFYNTKKYEYTTNPYIEKLLDGSPRNLIVEEAAPGNPWKMASDHTTKKDYELAGPLDNVIRYIVKYNSSSDPYKPTLVKDGVYMHSTQTDARPPLFKFVSKNENWVSSDGTLNTTETFVDYQNRTLLKKSYVKNEQNRVVYLETYYVYDDYGNLIYVLPPNSDPGVQGGVTQENLNKYCYQYKYDALNRLIESKLPGKEREYVVYNKIGQVIMTQDGELKKQNKWLFTKFDELGRNIYSGIMNSSASRNTLQTAANQQTSLFESRSDSYLTLGGTKLYYTNKSFPTNGITELHTIQYYDSYLSSSASDYTTVPTTNKHGQNITKKTKGLATVSKVMVLETNPAEWIITTTGYDKYGQVIWANSFNEYLSSSTRIDHKLDFDGTVLQTETEHSGIDKIMVKDYFHQDHLGRVVQHSQKINNQSEELIERRFYDELGQLDKKEVGGSVLGDGLQTISFGYNIRGWLKSINDINSLQDDLFALKLNYTNLDMGISGATGNYNGNISETLWRTANTEAYGNRKRGYSFQYDKLNRLSNAYFRRANSSGTSFNEQTSHYNVNGLTYDYNGNLKTLTRRGLNEASNSFGTIDNLSYLYNGNQLRSVSDSGGKQDGFEDKATATQEFDYDSNGNLKFNLNTGIQNVSYNHLNLPKSIFVQNNMNDGLISYKYAANGSKIEEYIHNSGIKKHYDHGVVYENNKFKYLNLSEGYVNKENGVYDYVYYFTDHLGNIRLTYTDLSTNGKIEPASEILQEKNYYPFGMRHKGYNLRIKQNYGFGYVGKEENEVTNLLDFGPRFYDPALGQWLSFDPAAADAKQIDKSPYAYSWNNPVSLSDPTGMHPDWNNDMYQAYREALKRERSFGEQTFFFNLSDDEMASISGKPNDFYRKLGTNDVAWFDGNYEIEGYEHLGKYVGHTDANGNRTFYNGDDQSQYFNGQFVASLKNGSTLVSFAISNFIAPAVSVGEKVSQSIVNGVQMGGYGLYRSFQGENVNGLKVGNSFYLLDFHSDLSFNNGQWISMNPMSRGEKSFAKDFSIDAVGFILGEVPLPKFMQSGNDITDFFSGFGRDAIIGEMMENLLK